MPYVYLIKPNASQETNLYKIGMTNGNNNEQRFKSYGNDAYLILSCETDYPRTIEKKLIEEFDSMFNKKEQTNEYYYINISEEQVKHLFMSIVMQVEQDDIPEESSIQMFSDEIVTNFDEAIESISVTAGSIKLINFFEDKNVYIHEGTGCINIANVRKIFNDLERIETKKFVGKWNEKSTTKRMVSQLAQRLSKPKSEVWFTINTGKKIYHGTYVHPALLNNFLEWLQPSYAGALALVVQQWNANLK